MTADQNGNTFGYDAWNRLVEAKNSSGSVLITYSYDAEGRRITEDRSGTVTTLYYSSQWQVVEEQVSGVTRYRYVWSPVYVNAMVFRDQLNSDGSLNQRLYAVQDANWNVTALVDVTGNVVERYVYTPYGVTIVYDANWNVRTGGSQFAWVYNFQAGRSEALTGLYYFEQRDYSAALGRWIEVDPIAFGAGDTNLYRYVGDEPDNHVDPTGMAPITIPNEWEWEVKQSATQTEYAYVYRFCLPSGIGCRADKLVYDVYYRTRQVNYYTKYRIRPRSPEERVMDIEAELKKLGWSAEFDEAEAEFWSSVQGIAGAGGLAGAIRRTPQVEIRYQGRD
jgi:RHS repeat-associated protein